LLSPLASVFGLINLANVEDDKTKLHYYFELQEKTLWKLENFVTDLLIYSRNTRLEIGREKIDFDRLVEDSLQLYTHLGNYEKIEKIVKIDQQHAFISDEKRISVILNNLISNAIRYSNPYQHAPYLSVNILTDTQKALVEISDNGLGIASKHIPKIFDMFYRGDATAKGSGLGLFIVKDTVTKLQGTIKVTSEVNQGTTFKITLPSLKTE
jgi:signal transduction histidine kinase